MRNIGVLDQELTEIRRLVARDRADASIAALSEDRRFATAYNTVLQTKKMAIACSGYRVASVPGHHRLTFEGAKLEPGKSSAQLADNIDACRRQRNGNCDYWPGAGTCASFMSLAALA